MAAIYVRWIRAEKMTIDDVPVLWRDAVKAAIGRKDK